MVHKDFHTGYKNQILISVHRFHGFPGYLFLKIADFFISGRYSRDLHLMMDKGLQPVKTHYPEIRYLFYEIKRKDRQNYIMQSKAGFINFIKQIAINLIYCKKNNLKLTATQIRRLKSYKSAIKRFLAAKTLPQKKRALTPDLLHVLLSIFCPVIERMSLV